LVDLTCIHDYKRDLTTRATGRLSISVYTFGTYYPKFEMTFAKAWTGGWLTNF